MIKVEPTPRPFDPDQLPLQAHQTEDERRYAARLQAHAYASAGAQDDRPDGRGGRPGGLRPRQFSIRAIAGRVLGSD